MNIIRTTLLVGSLAFATSAFAQILNRASHNQIHIQKSQNPTERDIHKVLEEITKGHKILGEGLPIYDGHRVEAMEMATIAKNEILKGTTGVKNDHIEKHTKASELEKARKYSAQLVHQSNERLVMGGRRFENALSLINQVPADSQGRKANAVEALNRALVELKTALAPYGGPQANMPKNTTKNEAGRVRGTIHP
jgi:hypothetical protein